MKVKRFGFEKNLSNVKFAGASVFFSDDLTIKHYSVRKYYVFRVPGCDLNNVTHYKLLNTPKCYDMRWNVSKWNDSTDFPTTMNEHKWHKITWIY